MLYFAMNDPFRYLFDNQGEVEAEIYLDTPLSADATAPARLEIVAYSYMTKPKRAVLPHAQVALH